MTLHPDTLWQVDVVLLRRRDWLRQHLSDDGRHVWLAMPEMGVEGPALLQDVRACGPIADGPGRVVTGTFHHRTGMAFDVKFSGESSPTGVTALHPIWSVDRREWISAIELQIGERVKTWRGYATVQWIRPRLEPEPVLNIEVEGDHVYRVGESGVLVHNTSAPTQQPNTNQSNQQGACKCTVTDIRITATPIPGGTPGLPTVASGANLATPGPYVGPDQLPNLWSVVYVHSAVVEGTNLTDCVSNRWVSATHFRSNARVDTGQDYSGSAGNNPNWPTHFDINQAVQEIWPNQTASTRDQLGWFIHADAPGVSGQPQAAFPVGFWGNFKIVVTSASDNNSQRALVLYSVTIRGDWPSGATQPQVRPNILLLRRERLDISP